MIPRSLVDAVRRPEYTGANRCLPCTAVNVALVAVGSLLVGALVPLAGVAAAAAGLLAIWLRGYVVPGTPTLTRRYLPDPVLALFGKAPAPGTAGSAAPATPDSPAPPADPPSGDPAEQLTALGVVDDAALDPSFRAAWADEATRLADDERTLRGAAAATLSVDVDAVALTRPAEGGVSLSVDDAWVGAWPSRTALVADLATERVLAGDGAWLALPRPRRADLAARIRGLARRCPACDAATRVSDETVASCCRASDVVAVSCPDCDERLAEFDPSPDRFAAGR